MSEFRPRFKVTKGGEPRVTNTAVPFDFLADRVRGCKLTTGYPNTYISTKCFPFPDLVNRMGNAGRDKLIGPDLNQVDFSGHKNIPVRQISKKGNLQLRLENYNLLNHTTSTRRPAVSRITTASGIRLTARN